ncbi:hypothetical protein [Streptomyces sp. NPDC101150]|uniref:effector-associated constant component EACC1 n=1 Tax=Streptomyces sp. NPDC101150 TaxID=3366114 RepID=UPI00380B3D23
MEERMDGLRVEIGVAADDADLAILDLYRWLRQDPDVRDHAELNLGPPRAGDGTMGAVEVIDLVLGQGFAAVNLALACAAWRAARPAAPAITLTANGTSITVRGNCDDATLQRIVAALHSASAEVPPSPDAAGPRRPGSEPEGEPEAAPGSA